MLITSNFQKPQGTLWIYLQGDVKEEDIAHLKHHLTPFLDMGNLKKVVLNCERLSVIEQEGWQYLCDWRDQLNQHNVRTVLISNF